MSPRRPSRPNERRSARRDTSASGSVRWACGRADHPPSRRRRRGGDPADRNGPSWPPKRYVRSVGTVRCAKSSRVRTPVNVPPLVLGMPVTGVPAGPGLRRQAPGSPNGDERSPLSPRSARSSASRSSGRAAAPPAPEQVPLPGPDLERADELQLLRRLEALRHDQRPPSVRQVLQRLDHLVRCRADRCRHGSATGRSSRCRSAISRQQPEPGIAGADIVGGDPHPGGPTRVDGPDQAVHVLDRLALGQLEDHAARVDTVALEQA